MRILIYALPLLALLCQVVEPAGFHALAGPKQPFMSLPMLLVLAFMGFRALLFRDRSSS